MRSPQVNDEDLPAAFWENLPSDESNADLAAIRALEAESTPEERAENFKVSGIAGDFQRLRRKQVRNTLFKLPAIAID